MIGVEPAWRGRGISSILLEHVVFDAAETGLPLCLVTDRPENVTYCQRAHFAMVWSGTTHDGRVPLWSFRTKPDPNGRTHAR